MRQSSERSDLHLGLWKVISWIRKIKFDYCYVPRKVNNSKNAICFTLRWKIVNRKWKNDYSTGLFSSRMYINIVLDTVLAMDVNKYSLASAKCQPIWQDLSWRTGSIFSCCKGLWDCRVLKPITAKHQSVFWFSQSRRMSAIYVGICQWISLVAATAEPVVQPS